MIPKYYVNKIDTIIILFLCLFLIGFFNEHLTSFKSIGIGGALMFTILNISKNRSLQLKYPILIYNNNKISIHLFMLFFTVVFISSTFAYSDNIRSLYYLYREIKYPIIFLFIIIMLKPSKKSVDTILLAIVLSTIILNIHFFYKGDLLNGTLKIDRFFSSFFEITFPFSLISFLTIKNNLFKLFIFIFSICLGITLLLLTGARGSWFMIFFESLIILSYILIKNRELLKKHKYYLIVGIIFICTLLIYLYTHSNLIKVKINQGSYTSGRDIIIKDRFPIFLVSNTNLIGLGYGTFNYTKFLNDRNTTKRIGYYNKEKNIYIYWHDEPFLISVFYHYGFIGFILLSIFLIYFIIYNLVKLKKTNYSDEMYFQVAIFSSFIGIFFMRGLFENMHMKYVIILYFLYLIINTFTNDKHENSLHIS